MLTRSQVQKANKAADEKMGTKFCFKCNVHRPIQGGGYILNNKAQRFLCKSCMERRNGAK